ncbi:hypothetical protein DFJ74DRAFT_666201 [Hyaloraphidium curvatum]|nr:hypothetical protein DFJ74DRAFT_666201 [Hyaloraphidium curvatum]
MSRRAKPAAAANPAEAVDPLPPLFDELLRAAQADDGDRVVRTADKILKVAPGDADALAAKLVALVRADKFGDAIALLGSFPKDLRAQAAFEEAYCLYRLNKHEEAMAVIDASTAAGDDGPAKLKMEQLRAQVAYKAEDYKTAMEITKGLVQQVPAHDQESSEYLTNHLAAVAGLLLAGDKAPGDALEGLRMPDRASLQLSYETAYNLGCYFAGLGDWDRAVSWLEVARSIGRKALQDEGSSDADEQLQQDLATIAIELSYVYQKQGRSAEAAELSHDILRAKVTDPLLTAIASANALSSRGPHNDLLGSAKRFKSALTEPALAKMAAYQRRPVDVDDALVSLWTNKPAEAKSKVQQLASKYGEDDLAAAAAVGLSVLDRKPQKTLEALREAVAKRPKSLRLRLSLCQALVEQSDFSGALESLQALVSDSRSASDKALLPGLMKLLVLLYEKQDQPDKALALMEEVASLKDGQELGLSLRMLADLKTKCGRLEDAAKDLELLHARDPSDVQAIAGLVAIYSKLDPAKAARFDSLLPDTAVEKDSSKVDVDALENASVRAQKGARAGAKAPQAGATDAAKAPKKRKRKVKLPKNHDPAVQPDPERWLPKQQRSTYARKGKKKMQMLRGPQGGSSSYAGAGSGSTGSARIAGLEQRKDTEEAGETAAEAAASPKAEPAPAKKAPPPAKKKSKGKGKW